MIGKRTKIIASIGLILILLLAYAEYKSAIPQEEPKKVFLGELQVKIETLYTNYKQYDDRWASYTYSYTSMDIGGCGPAAIANLAYIKNQTSTPIEVADWLTANGYSTYKNGTARKGIAPALVYYGYTDVARTYYNSDILAAFDANTHEMGIFLMRGGAGGIT